MSLVYLVKDSNDLVSHCHCDTAYITFPPQMDCPWCGCGWLFTCIQCRKAFTFARGVQLEEAWHDLARCDLTNQWHNDPSDEDVEQWVAAMQELLADVKVGERYVCLDGSFIPADAGGVEFDGWYAAHDLEFIPQVAALDEPSICDTILSSVDYWRKNALPRRGD